MQQEFTPEEFQVIKRFLLMIYSREPKPKTPDLPLVPVRRFFNSALVALEKLLYKLVVRAEETVRRRLRELVRLFSR